MIEVLGSLLLCHAVEEVTSEKVERSQKEPTLDGCVHGFRELAVDVLPGYMDLLRVRLVNPWPLGPLTERGVGPATFAKRVGLKTDIPGCYVLVDQGRAIYVGISKHVFARLLEHVRGSDHYSATLAYQIAVGDCPHNTTAAVAIKDPQFRARFEKCRERLRNLSAAFIEIENALVRYLFEPYCAMELRTGIGQGGWNTFVTH